jgi:hypothetical protein
VNSFTRKHQPKTSILFSNCNLAATIPDATFAQKIPHDYEGIPAIQRASAIGTMLARPPAAAVTIAVGGTNYYYADNVFYARAYQGGTVVYQVVGPPTGAVIRTLPVGCTTARVGGVVYQRCGTTYY